MKDHEKKDYLSQTYKVGLYALKKGESSLALEKFNLILKAQPENADILSLVSICYSNLKKLEQAENYISKAIKNKPDEIGFYINWGNILIKMERYSKAEKVYKDAIKLNLKSADLYYNLGVLYSIQKKHQTAINQYNKSLKINKFNKHALNNLGNSYKELGDYKIAINFFNEAINLDNNFSEAKYNLGLVLLLTNPSHTAWEQYEFRKINNDKEKNLIKSNIKKWDGSNLKNKSIIIFSEQGIGDNIQFARYIKLIKKEKTNIILYTNKSLEFLFHKMHEIDEMVFEIKPNKQVDYYISIMSLPYIFRYNNKVPTAYNFFHINNKDNEYWKNKIKKDKELLVGLSWQGNNTVNKNDYKRSMKLNKLNAILSIKNINFISLQKDFGRQQIKEFNYQNIITDFYDNIDLSPFKETLAIINNLDLIICVDTVIAHIAATLGKETWIMLPFVPDFRWGIKGSNTHWYGKNVKLFRQKKINDWDNVVFEIKSLLETKK